MFLATEIVKRLSFWYRYNFPELFMKRNFLEFPDSVQIETSSYCNGRCKYCCYSETKHLRPDGVMSDELFKKIVDECANYDVKQMPLFLMNEPLSDKKILERIEYADRVTNADVYISTNASMLTKEIADKLVNMLDRIVISMQGGIFPDDFKKYTGLDYDTVMRNLEYFLTLVNKGARLKPENIEINTVIGRDEEKQKEYWKKWNVNFGGIGKLHSMGSTVFDSKIENPNDVRGCYFDFEPLHRIFISHDGKVILCCMDWRREIILGDLNKDTIYDVWNSERYNKIRKILFSKEPIPENMLCARCEYAINFSHR